MINGRDGSNWSDIISDFMDYTANVISPPIHRLWSAISLVGGACERRVWTMVGDYINFPHLYILLVAPPGTGKSIINTVKELWREAEDGTKSKVFHVASDSLTRASFVDELKDAETTRIIRAFPFIYHSLLVAAEEFEVLLPFYDSHFISTLNDLWNAKKDHIEKRRHGPAKEVIIDNPQLHVLGGAQPSYFVAHFPEEAWTTGLARRVIMVYADSAPRHNPFQRTENRKILRDKILRGLSNISEMYQEIKILPAVESKLTDWYMNDSPPKPTHSRLAGYSTTRFEFLIKLCTISRISRMNGSSLFIEDMDLERASGWLFEAEKYMPDIFRAMIGKSDSQVIEELHRHVMAVWAKTKVPIKTSAIIEFLGARVPSEKVNNIFQVAERSGLISRATNTVDSWVPRPNLRLIHGE